MFYVFIILLIVFILFNYMMMQRTVNKYLKQLNIYTNDIINNNFYKFDSSKLVYNNIISISDDISAISKKMANIISELNINRSVLEVKISTDSLTKLPNTKIFEQDMKSLFLAKTQSYIIKIKIECLKEFSKNNLANKIDSLVLTFVNHIKKNISSHSNNNNLKFYRIYGSEFIIIAKDMKFNDIDILLQNISNNTDIKDKYNVNSKIAHIVSIPFDYYSSTATLLEKLDDIYKKTINTPNSISYYTEKDLNLNEEDSKLESTVFSIIKNSAFTLSYKFDTYSLTDNQLIMQEVAPNLINIDGSNIPIGSFISIAQEKDLAIEFDKEVIIKSFKYIQQYVQNHKIAINISIDSMCSNEFITWLESQLLYDYKDIVDKAVISITSFAIKNNFEEFVNFSNQIKRFNGKILLKRFNYNDLTIEQLEQINVDYIRIHKDYTINIDAHKKSVLGNILDFTISQNIIIFADSISNENDLKVLKSLDFNGTSKDSNV